MPKLIPRSNTQTSKKSPTTPHPAPYVLLNVLYRYKGKCFYRFLLPSIRCKGNPLPSRRLSPQSRGISRGAGNVYAASFEKALALAGWLRRMAQTGTEGWAELLSNFKNEDLSKLLFLAIKSFFPVIATGISILAKLIFKLDTQSAQSTIFLAGKE